VVSLDQVRALLANHVDRILDAAIRDDWDNGSIDYTEVLDTVNLELRINRALANILGQTGGAARVE
jgi:hypothetical protein